MPQHGIAGALGEGGDLRGCGRRGLIRSIKRLLRLGRLGGWHQDAVDLAVADRQQVLALVVMS